MNKFFFKNSLLFKPCTKTNKIGLVFYKDNAVLNATNIYVLTIFIAEIDLIFYVEIFVFKRFLTRIGKKILTSPTVYLTVNQSSMKLIGTHFYEHLTSFWKTNKSTKILIQLKR